MLLKSKTKNMFFMRKMGKILLLQGALLLAACNGYKPGEPSADVAITIDSIRLDSATVDYIDNCSYTGFRV